MNSSIDSTVQALYERELVSYVKRKLSEGEEILKKEDAYRNIQNCIDYVEGKHRGIKSSALSSIVDNRIRKNVYEVVSALTDVRLIWNYETYDEKYKEQGEILNKLARAWWKNSASDRKLQRALFFAAVGGSGYAALTWNPDLAGGGDLELIPLDPRDVIPMDPVYSDSIQDWRGVILRQKLPIDTIKQMYPAKSAEIAISTISRMETPKGGLFESVSAQWAAISGKVASKGSIPGSVELYRVYMKDDSIHTGDEPKEMGDPDSNWSYTVYPIGYQMPNGEVATWEDAKLYPRGRMVVCTSEVILEDGPNPYWHGLFPVVRFTLDTNPWSLLGSSLVSDMIPLQDALNECLRGAEDGIKQWVQRGIITDKNAVSKATLSAMDSRKPGLKAALNPTAGEGFKIIDGPNLPTWYFEVMGFLKNEMDENSGVKGLSALQKIDQGQALQSDNAAEAIQASLSPINRIRARSIEVSLGELAEMLKVGFFQYYNTKRRIQVLGKDGATLEDFDYDPGNMVPSDEEGDSTGERARKHHRNFTFSIAPNSFLNVSHATQKMLMMQLFRANGIDIFSLWDALDVSGTGPMPASTVPERMVFARRTGLQAGPTPEMVMAQEQVALAQAQAQILQLQQAQAIMGAQAQGGGGGQPPPGGGAPPSPPPPPGGQLSHNGVGSQGGRPPSGGQLPQMIVKNGPEGPRTVISESGR